MGAAIEIVDLSKRYGAIEAVKQVSLRIAPGEFVTFLGPSGSGKTTMLSAIAGFISLSAGQILIDGRRSEHVSPEHRNIGVVFQHYALFPHMTVSENVAFPLRMRSMHREKVAEMVQSTLAAVQMTAFAHRFPSELSGGQQQRIALARAIVFNPQVLLLDEPLSALDKNLRESMQIELKRLHLQTNITMVYVTHDQEEALLLSDRVVVMNEGRIEQVGRPEEIYSRPQNRFVAQFVGKSNFLSAKVIERQGGQTILRSTGGLRCIGGALPSAAVGASVSMMVRPEQILVGPQVASAANRFRGRIEEKFFLGATINYRFALSSADSVVATIRSPAPPGLSGEIGSDVDVGWRPEDVSVFDY